MAGLDDNASWQRLRVRVALSWIAIMLFFPGVPLIVIGLNRISPGVGENASGWIIGVVAALNMVVWYLRFSFRCPQCGGWFFSTGSWSNPFAKKCLHCGLPRNAQSV